MTAVHLYLTNQKEEEEVVVVVEGLGEAVVEVVLVEGLRLV